MAISFWSEIQHRIKKKCVFHSISTQQFVRWTNVIYTYLYQVKICCGRINKVEDGEYKEWVPDGEFLSWGRDKYNSIKFSFETRPPQKCSLEKWDWNELSISDEISSLPNFTAIWSKKYLTSAILRKICLWCWFKAFQEICSRWGSNSDYENDALPTGLRKLVLCEYIIIEKFIMTIKPEKLCAIDSHYLLSLHYKHFLSLSWSARICIFSSLTPWDYFLIIYPY